MNPRTLPLLLVSFGLVLAITASFLIASPIDGAPQYLAATLSLLVLFLALLMRIGAGITLFLCVIPFLGMFRRIMLTLSPVSADPLLLVIPTFTFMLFLVITVSYRRHVRVVLRQSLTARLTLLLMAVFALQIANPLQGSIAVGLAGTIYYLVPLCWFFIGKVLVTPSLFGRALSIFLVVSCVSASYGLMQEYRGLPDYDLQWALHAASTYSALYVSVGSIRAFGPMSSAAEYTVFVGTAFLALAALLIYHAKHHHVLPAALLLLALFLESSRGALISSSVTVLVLVTLRQHSRRFAAMVLLVILVGGAVAYAQFSAAHRVLVQALARQRASSPTMSMVWRTPLTAPIQPGRCTCGKSWQR